MKIHAVICPYAGFTYILSIAIVMSKKNIKKDHFEEGVAKGAVIKKGMFKKGSKGGRPKKNMKKDSIEESAKSYKLKEFNCKVCVESKHSKQACSVVKKQRMEELQAYSAAAIGASREGTVADPG
ncbi:hypothetical protein VNO77_24348 [Canavalia gladiata]|uniref:Uncharacterized protein n=1 Tax=Canavalia gladiata TaxID=3824 RepID=A0AAN9L639_CANGL